MILILSFKKGKILLRDSCNGKLLLFKHKYESFQEFMYFLRTKLLLVSHIKVKNLLEKFPFKDISI